MAAKRYLTKGNLNRAWTHVDNALSEINLVNELLYDMTDADDKLGQLKQYLEEFDESELVRIKNLIEEMVEEKEKV